MKIAKLESGEIVEKKPDHEEARRDAALRQPNSNLARCYLDLLWRPIETAPRDGSRVLCVGPNVGPDFLVWKTNPRIVAAHQAGQFLDHVASYFGDDIELDDYDYALPENAPTLWLPLPELPFQKKAGT